MKTHRFTLEVKTHKSMESAKLAVLSAFAGRDPDGCEFTLRKSQPKPHGDVMADIIAEVRRATHKFPTWPTDPLHALAVLGEEFGELTKEMLQLTYEPHKSEPADVRLEAIQTAAMAIRLVMSLDRYRYDRQPQHEQEPF